ncbi:T9SS type B sorting domain-containing protein [Pseudozobellia thermophila]|uniref:Gliding motility-associated C-terminal domain-containing protein n=1 Tax=Pseudozobellia thermophila TaxID=192903 RepID=A0A1M6L7P0_9FLAO|nr:gliding motility-associated C-terminal domain-containing protein [Pseudozobellia thermophila]SHJ67174.1 gliding motility-associated C-terminal domain-containing protein [Pseudozobellia thermophila]
MFRKITTRGYFLLLIFLTSSVLYVQGQTYATTVSSQNEVDLSANAIDGDLNTHATIRANSGLVAGLGSYSGNLDLAYPSDLPSNTTSYVRLETQDDILSSLLGGSLGGLLSDVVGVLLIGNQEFSVSASYDNVVVVESSSSSVDAFSTDEARVVIDANGDFYVAMTPTSVYNTIGISNRTGSLIGLNQTKNLEVAAVYYGDAEEPCGSPSYTSFDGHGISLDLLGLGGAGVTDPESAIDGDSGTYSKLGLGILNVAADIEQTFYFNEVQDATNTFYIQLSVDPSLVSLGVLNALTVTGQNGSNAPVFSSDLSSLISLDLLGLLQNGDTATIGFQSPEPINRLTLTLSSLLGVDIEQHLNIYEVFAGPEAPTLNIDAEGAYICEGSTIDLTASVANGSGVELRWYDAADGGNLLATTSSGGTFTTPVLTEDTTYYVASGRIGCAQESPRTEALIHVEDIPTAADITITGNEGSICSSNDVVLVPNSSIDGDFSWYFDANMVSEITDGTVSGGASYQIDGNDRLIISGLTEAGGPYTYYTALTTSRAACQNAPGDLQSVTVDVVDYDKNVTITSVVTKTLDDLISIFDGNNTTTVSGTVSGDVNTGEIVSLLINGQQFDGVVQADSSFEISVDALDLVSDADGIIETIIDNGICLGNDEILIELPDLSLDNLLQVFCRTELATVADIELGDDDLVLFDSLDALVQVDADTPLADGDVYFAGILGIPASVLARVAVTVQINDVPEPTTTSELQEFCDSLSPTVADIQVNEANVVFYDSAAGGSMIDPSTPLADGGRYYVAAVENGCESSSRLRIMVSLTEDDFEAITLDGESEDACLNTAYTYVTQSGKNNYGWEVTGGTITDGGTATDDFVTVEWTEEQDNSLTVSYEDASGCNPNKSMVLDVNVTSCGMVLGEEFCLKVYNEFSPNNDGFNEVFKVQCIEDYSNTLEIYNRNGNLVYKTADYRNTWTGIANVNGVLSSGDHLPSGTYYYVINIPELERNLVGWLQLAR